MTRETHRLYLIGAAVFLIGAAANVAGSLTDARWLLYIGIAGVVVGATLEVVALSRYVSGRKRKGAEQLDGNQDGDE